MIAQKQRGLIQRPVSRAVNMPAPTGGWNARDVLSEMAPNDAVILDNWYPSTTSVNQRYGYSEWATGLPAPVETLMPYAGPSSDKLFAACGTEIYDVTASGAVGAADVTGLTNARWQYINVGTAAGNFIRAVNGADKSIVYNGTAWFEDGDGAPYDITGVDSADCVQINLFKNRIWLIENNSLNVWYLGTNALGGPATVFPLYGVATLGGHVVAMGTWTIDAGAGADDYAVFVTSKGQVIVYQGTDPATAATWALHGVWNLGSPVGRRCMMKYAGDLLIICKDGVLPLSGALQSSRVQPQVALSFKIQRAVSNAVTQYGSNYGWQLLYFPRENQLWLNVPTSGTVREQYVMNTITKSWARYTDWNFTCFELFNDTPYGGSGNSVVKLWDTLADNGVAINANALQAFQDYKMPGVRKRWVSMQPMIRTDGSPLIYAAMNIDFDETNPTTPITLTPTASSVWDGALWDVGVWGSGTVVNLFWQGCSGVGVYGGIRLKTQAAGMVIEWISTTLVMERGGILG
jgi:hypothetical protein